MGGQRALAAAALRLTMAMTAWCRRLEDGRGGNLCLDCSTACTCSDAEKGGIAGRSFPLSACLACRRRVPVLPSQPALEHLTDRAARSSSMKWAPARRCALPMRWVEPLQELGLAAALAAERRKRPASRPTCSEGTPTTDTSVTAECSQHRLEVARVDVEAAGDDHVLLAVEQRRKPSASNRPTSPVRMKRLPAGSSTLPRASWPAGCGSRASSGRAADHLAASPVRPRALPRRSGDVVASPAGRRCAACPDAGAPARAQLSPPSVMP